MRLFASVRARLIAMVVALLAVTLGVVAIISTRVAHFEIRKVDVQVHQLAPGSLAELGDYFDEHGSWAGVGPLIDRLARSRGTELLLFDASRSVVASSKREFVGARIVLLPDGAVLIERRTGSGRIAVLFRGASIAVHGGTVLVMPLRDVIPPNGPRTRSLDRAFFLIFAGAALFGVLMAIALARWISVPVERLTAAARRMETGDLTVRVEPSGGAQLEELAHSFNAMAAAIDRNEELRRRMVSDVAHELRAPLTNLRCELESIQDGLTTATPERISSLHDETMHLSALVDDLQDLSLADAGRLEIDARPTNVSAIVKRAAAGMESRGVKIVAEGSEEVMAVADARRVVQILTNLLSNAIAAETEAVRITWEVVDGEIVDREVLIRVIDHGIGIAADELPRIFERFYRVDASRSRATGGAGLGLPIVRQLVLAHGGRVWAESTLGAGSTFSFTLPLAAA
jgi:signal transduction histidine kinase